MHLTMCVLLYEVSAMLILLYTYGSMLGILGIWLYADEYMHLRMGSGYVMHIVYAYYCMHFTTCLLVKMVNSYYYTNSTLHA